LQCLRRVLHYGAASVGRYPLCCDGEQVFKIAAAGRLLDVDVYLVLPDASIAHGLDGAAQDGKRVVLSKKPDFDVRKFLIHVARLDGERSPVCAIARAASRRL
jgi:hypothetical protein